MANFLSNLVNRFNQKADMVQARPVSLFEPQTNLDISAWAGNVQTKGEVEAGRKQSAPFDAGAAKPDFSKQSANPEQIRHPRTENMSNSLRAHPDRQTKPTRAQTSGSLTQLGYLVVEPRFLSNQPTGEQQQTTILESTTQEEIALLKRQRGANPEESPPSQEEQATVRPEKHIIRPKRRETGESLQAAQLHPLLAAEKNSSSAEQVINVTIGRVEVQAVPQIEPAKLQKEDRPSPVMSLEEYLNSRDQERQP